MENDLPEFLLGADVLGGGPCLPTRFPDRPACHVMRVSSTRLKSTMLNAGQRNKDANAR